MQLYIGVKVKLTVEPLAPSLEEQVVDLAVAF